MTDLTAEQRAILADLRGALRVAAGAGTGKTDTLRLAIVELIRRGVRPGEILCLTFTVEATQEMRRRVLREFSGRADLDPDELTVQTYHAFGASIVREHALLAGLSGDPALLDQARKWQLLLEALEHCSFDHLEIGWLPNFLTNLLTLHDEMQRHLATISDVDRWCVQAGTEAARLRAEALRAIRAYARLKRERNAIDFGDQIGLAVWLLRERPEILERLRRRYRYLFLDEYQDTDVAQRELVKLIGAGAELVCAVGDVDQGIFGWRGATIFNMSSFPDDFPGARTETLSTNFRSGQRILDLANALVHEFQRPAGDVREPLTAHDGKAAEIEAFVAPHHLEEAEGIAERIAAAGPPWSQYAVLCRRRDQFDPVFRALSAHGVPVEVDTLGGFWTRPEILDVTAWLELLADPADNIALARILLGPAYRLGRRDLFFLADHAKGQNREQRRQLYGDREVLPYALIDAIVAEEEIPELSAEARERVRSLRATWCELSRIAARASLAELVGELARVTGLAGELAASPNPEAELALRHLAKLQDIAQGYEPVAGSRDLAGFVAYLDSIDEAAQDEDELRAVEPNAVRLLTLHRAKGLEWEVVFLPGLSKGIIPSERASENPAEKWWRLPFGLRGDRDFLPEETADGLRQLKDEEERRLIYVGITRAKRRLVLSRLVLLGEQAAAGAVGVLGGGAGHRTRARRARGRAASREPVSAGGRAAGGGCALRAAAARSGGDRAHRARARPAARAGGPPPARGRLAAALHLVGDRVSDLRSRSGGVLLAVRPPRPLPSLAGRAARDQAASPDRAARPRRRRPRHERRRPGRALRPRPRRAPRRRRRRLSRGALAALLAQPLRPQDPHHERATVHLVHRPRTLDPRSHRRRLRRRRGLGGRRLQDGRE